ncbi:MAG: TIGR04255 family protein [Gammaproteobacteria bacterium]|nr:TIGR04255 family protein [Gammaproteobacteria bacterium]
MAESRKLSNPPITEALIDIQVEPVTTLNKELVERAYSTFSKNFPEKRPLRSGELIFTLDVDKGPSSDTLDKGFVGYHFFNQEGGKLVQFRKDGFTFNKLHPYDNWESVCSEAKEFWSIYKNTISPKVIKRIAIRYINRIDIPLGAELSEYFNGAPVIPAGIPASIEKFITRTTVKNSDIDSSANITLAYEGVNKSEKASILLDIDVYEVLKLDVKEDGFLWDKFEEFHDFKNNIFFNSVTDKTLESYL